jgi:hypothetical protein
MFDPTVFDNLKVVIEGAIYDLDLDGRLMITDREDQVELAKMSRKYRISFKDKTFDQVKAYIDLKIDLDNLVTELRSHTEQLPGCKLEIGFLFEMITTENCPTIQDVLTSIWGGSREIQQTITFQYGVHHHYINNSKIIFHRLIHEENIDDLLSMIEYIVDSIEQISQVIK